MRASVIVPTFNRRKTLERTLAGLFEQTVEPQEFEVVVVDDHSLDDTATFLESIGTRHANLRTVRHEENRGRAVTRNDGILVAQGEIVIFLDDDCRPCRTFIEAHLECHRRAVPERIAVMGNVRFAEESLAGSNFARYIDERYLGNRPEPERRGLNYANLPARYFGSGNASVRREDAVRAGMFDAGFRYYGGEDVYFGHCLKQAGNRICFCEEARAVHYDDVSIERYKVKYRETAREGLRMIQGKDARLIDECGVRRLMPPALGTDSLWTIATKAAIRLVLNRRVVSGLEWWARHTDRHPFLFSRASYRGLLAGWYLQGLNSKFGEGTRVTYGGE